MKIFIIFLLTFVLSANDQSTYFSNVNKQIPSIHFDMRYYTDNNFIGKPIDGYHAPICFLTNETALALQNVQSELQKEGFTLKVFDCYRPQRAVDHFVRWAKDIDDTKMKSTYYPNVDKKDLFRDGYIAAKSGHSRGSTIDLTIDGLDMGTPFDFFDLLSHTNTKSVTKEQHKNRMVLKKVMEKYGFKNYAEEWWHFTLKDELFKERYFNFAITQ